jgi:hypothetical protein
VLVDGNNTPIEAIPTEATRRRATVTIVVDVIHVLEYLCTAAWSFFDKGDPDAEERVRAQASGVLAGKANAIASGFRRFELVRQGPAALRPEAGYSPSGVGAQWRVGSHRGTDRPT